MSLLPERFLAALGMTPRALGTTCPNCEKPVPGRVDLIRAFGDGSSHYRRVHLPPLRRVSSSLWRGQQPQDTTRDEPCDHLVGAFGIDGVGERLAAHLLARDLLDIHR